MYILNDTIGPDSDVSTSGNITVTGSGKFTGDGSGLTSLPAGQGGIGVKTDSGTVGYGVTLLASLGWSFNTVSSNSWCCYNPHLWWWWIRWWFR